MKRQLSRIALALVATLAMLPEAALAGRIPTDVMTILYRKEAPEAPNRLDPTIQAATRSLEKELINRNYRIQQTPPDVLKALDKSANVIVTFAPDAGLSMVFSVYRNLRPDPGVNVAAAEVAISARVFVGSSLLSVEEGRSVMRTNVDDKVKEFGERRAMELAAERAASSLVSQIDKRLRSLSPEQIASYAEISDVDSTQIIDLPAPPAPPAPVSVPTPAPGPQPTVTLPAKPPVASLPAPAPAPVPGAPAQPYIVVPPTVPGATPMERPAQRHAILIGVSDYSYVRQINRGSANDLPGVPTDINNVKATFGRLGFEPQNISVLFNRDATNAQVRSTIDRVAAKAGPNDLIAIYISGHGSPVDGKRQGMAMPIFYDFSMAQRNSAPDFQELLDMLTRSPADRFVMILDTCHSGGAALNQAVVVISARGASIGKSNGGASTGLLSRTVNGSRNVAILAASRPDESAIDGGAAGGGLFTRFLTRGLLAAPGQDVLRDVIERRVAPPVIDESRRTCEGWARQGNPCATGQQTPTLGFSGRGDMIRM
jgi:hypothetical protein